MFGSGMHQKWENDKKGFCDELVQLYASVGAMVTNPKGKSWHSRTLVCEEHDGVPYCMDSHGERGLRNIMHGVTHRKMMIERHHTKIKAIYEYCVGLGVGDICVLSGGGSQLQAFFGNDTGYLAILYLDLEDLAENKRLTDNGYLAACGNESHTLRVNWGKNNKLFMNQCKIPGVDVQKSG